jgi:hypothetical protein
MEDDKEKFSEEETSRRRDEVIRRMANTPRQHRSIRRKNGNHKTARHVSHLHHL